MLDNKHQRVQYTTRETTYNDQKLATTHNMWSSCGIPHRAKAYTVNTTTKLNPVVVHLLVRSLTRLPIDLDRGKKKRDAKISCSDLAVSKKILYFDSMKQLYFWRKYF